MNLNFRKEWVVSYDTIHSSKSEFLQKYHFALPLIGTNILQHVHNKEDNMVYLLIYLIVLMVQKKYCICVDVFILEPT